MQLEIRITVEVQLRYTGAQLPPGMTSETSTSRHLLQALSSPVVPDGTDPPSMQQLLAGVFALLESFLAQREVMAPLLQAGATAIREEELIEGDVAYVSSQELSQSALTPEVDVTLQLVTELEALVERSVSATAAATASIANALALSGFEQRASLSETATSRVVDAFTVNSPAPSSLSR
jgi:hypothetical protein